MENMKIANNFQVNPSKTSELSDAYDPDLKLSYTSIANQDHCNEQTNTFTCSVACATFQGTCATCG